MNGDYEETLRLLSRNAGREEKNRIIASTSNSVAEIDYKIRFPNFLGREIKINKRLQKKQRWKEMFRRSKFLSFPMVIGAVIIGVVSGKAIFGPPLDDYWRKKLQEEAAAKENENNST